MIQFDILNNHNMNFKLEYERSERNLDQLDGPNDLDFSNLNFFNPDCKSRYIFDKNSAFDNRHLFQKFEIRLDWKIS